MTDLIYRTDFKIEDFLTDENGHIDFESQALYPPEKIFPCRPTTMDDYRKIIVDSVGEVDNVWLSKVRDGDYTGLYDIAIKLKQDAVKKSHAEITTHIRQVYLNYRNLCEDLNEISIMREVDCELYADIEVRGGRTAVEVLAEIYYKCSRHISAGIRFYDFEQVRNDGKSLEEMFIGPFTNHGIIKQHELGDKQDEVFVADVLSIIKEIEGVEDIKNLYFKIDREVHDQTLSSESPEAVFHLRIPQDEDEIKVKLIKDGRELSVSTLEFKSGYRELNYEHRSLERTPQNISLLYTPPRGQYRNLRQYYSIQNHFPSIYGIDAYGVSESASPGVKAKAAQLKAYLAIFEQLMANYTANLNSLRTLFSPQNRPRKSYFFQTLKDDIIPGIEPIYKRPPSEILSKALRRHDKYADRKNRLLDYLLGLYGETFTQHSLRHFNYYYTPSQVEEVIIKNKIAFLKNIVEISRDRAGASNYNKPCWNSTNVAGLQRKVSLLLGFRQLTDRSLTMVFLKQGLKLLPHASYSRIKEGTLELEMIALDDIDEQKETGFQWVPIIKMSKKHSPEKSIDAINSIVPLKNNLISEALLRGGIYMDRYKLGMDAEDRNYRLVFSPKENGRWWYLATYPDQKTGIESANALRRYLIHLNIESEGLHVVEHILLRPKIKPRHEDITLSKQDDFYSFRVSVIFPAWTARCHDENFRLLAQETVQRNCPAHVYPQFYWFKFNKMYEFEVLYRKWMDLKRGEGVGADELDAAAERLIKFLIENKG
ncbi:MAG: hypothetical protein ABFS45_00425 [Pseudomonadota bacterium]